LVVFVGTPGNADRVDARKAVVAEVRDEGTIIAVRHVQGEIVFRIVSISCFVHSVSLSVDLLAGHCEGFARRWRCGFAKLDGAVFVCLGGVDELVDLISGFGGEFEQWAVALRVDFFRKGGHGCFVEMVGVV